MVRTSAPKSGADDDIRTLRLRHVATVDFRYNEAHHYQELQKKYPQLTKLGRDDVVLLISLTQSQIVFLHGFDELRGEFATNHAGNRRVCCHSERLRLVSGVGGGWHSTMLAEYARQVGIKLEGIMTLKEHLEERTKEKARS